MSNQEQDTSRYDQPDDSVDVEVPNTTRTGEVRSNHPGYYPPVSAEAPQVRQSRDRAQYVRQQKGHSVIKHALFGGFVLWIPTIYYTFSPNHYWHA